MDPIDPWVDAAEVRRLAESLLRPVRAVSPPNAEVCFGDGFVGFAGADLPHPGPRPAAATPPGPAHAPEPAVLPQIQEQARQTLAGARHRAESGGLLDRPSAAPPDTGISTPPVSAPPAAPPNAGMAASAPPSPEQPSPAPAPPPVTPPPPIPAAVEDGPQSLHTPFVERLHAYGAWLRRAVLAKAFFVSDREGHVLIDEVRSPKLLHVARTLAQASHAANRHAGGGTVGSLHVKLGEASILEVLSIETDYGFLILGIVVPGVLSNAAIQVVSSGLQQVVDGQPA